jgi:hypothetical protein
MGKKKWCFGREDFTCLTKDCPYMTDCVRVVSEKRFGRIISGMESRRRKSELSPGLTAVPFPPRQRNNEV